LDVVDGDEGRTVDRRCYETIGSSAKHFPIGIFQVLPEDLGGSGLSLGEVVPVIEQMGRRLMAGPFLSTTLAAQALLAGGTQAQRQSVLPAIAGGEAATLALTETDGNWDLTAIEARAEDDGDALALCGDKILVCDAATARWIIVSLRYKGEPALALVETTSLPAGALRREQVIDETKRAFSLSLDGVRVPVSALLAPERSRATLEHIHLAANLLGAGEMCGGARGVIDVTVDYLNTRKQFGRLIGAYQALKHPTVDAYVHYEQARSHLYAAAHSFDEQGAGEIATRMAKAQADMAFSFASDRAIQFHGGFGFTHDCDAGLYRRRAMWHAAQHGDATYHKRKLAKLLL